MRTKQPNLAGLALGAATLLLITLSACGDVAMTVTPPPPDPDQLHPSAPALQAAQALIAARPYESKVPAAYDDQKNWPLVILLHGYSASGFAQDLYFGLGRELDRLGFLYAYPDGTLDSKNHLFWNATDVCCDFEHKGIDDVAYLDAVIDDMSSHYRVDRRRVFVVGHSNGGFMSHRYACERADRVAAIVSLAGDNYKDAATLCKPQNPVAVLQVHGDMDTSVPFLGGTDPDTGKSLPSALETVTFWAGINGCTLTADTSAPDVDVDQDLAGKETTVTRFLGCKSGTAAELWRIRGGVHVPNFIHPDWANDIWGFFAAHPKP